MPRGDLKAYETLTARIPQALVDAARRYASQHHCTVSDMIRDSLQLYLDGGTSRVNIREQEVRQGQTEVLHEVLHEVRQGQTEVLHEVRRGHASLVQALSALSVQGQTEVRHAASKSGAVRTEVRQGQTTEDPGDGQTAVLPPAEPKRRGRPPVLRPGILALLDEHPARLTAAELKVYLGTEKHIGDTLAGMVKAALLVKTGSGHAIRYQLAEATAP